jgi:hypothetical protein
VGEFGDEGSDQYRYRVGEEGEHGVRVPPMPHREDLSERVLPYELMPINFVGPLSHQ